MKPKGSLPHLQQPATCPHPQPDQCNPCTQTIFWISILILFSHLRQDFTIGPIHSGFPTKTPRAALLSPIRTTCPAHVVILDLTTRIITGVEHISISFLLCSFLHSPVTSSLLGPNIFLQHPILKRSQPIFLPQFEPPCFTPITKTRIIIVLCTEYTLYTLFLILYCIISGPVKPLKIIDAPVQVSDILGLAVSFNFIKFSFQIFLPFLPEMFAASFTSCMFRLCMLFWFAFCANCTLSGVLLSKNCKFIFIIINFPSEF